MLQLLTQNQNNPQVFKQLIQEFAEYFNNIGDGVEAKIKEAEQNYMPTGVWCAKFCLSNRTTKISDQIFVTQTGRF